MLLLCYIHAVSAGHYANFYPINGTFQNFNPVRRFLSGQVSYRDFQDYLGVGHLYIGSVFTALLGGTYKSSLVAFSFLTFGCLALLSFVLGLAIFRKKEVAVAATNIVFAMLLVQPLFFSNAVSGTDEIAAALNYALGTGNSARFVRAMILPIIVLLLWAAYKCYIKVSSKKMWILKHKDLCTYAWIGLLSGFAFAWSNDYGISCWVCIALMTFWIAISKSRKFLISLRNTGIELVSSVVGLAITISIFTVGHFTEWISSTFGTGGYQRWYYNSTKSYYLYDVDFSYIMLIQAGISVAYLIKLFINKGCVESIKRHGIPGFANMVCFCAVNEYKMLSGGNSREVALSVLFLTVIFEGSMFIVGFENAKKRNREKLFVIVASCIVSASLIVSYAKDEFIFDFMTDKDGIYVEDMGGYLTSLGGDLLETNDFLKDNDFFATYASAQEVVSGKFQPSGTDYIIHVLGDQQREDYLGSFKSGDFTYAATIKETYTDWEYWVQRANWFFYRELYSNWHPIYGNTYEIYWERNGEMQKNTISNGIDLSVVDVSPTCRKIIIHTDVMANGIADVYIDYAINKNNNRSASIVFQRTLKVENTGTVYASQGSYYESNYLRAESQEYIPVPIVNGYGEVTLTAEPKRSTYLKLNEASCKRVFTCTSDYLEIADVVSVEGQSVICIENTPKNTNSLVNTSEVIVQGKTFEITSISNDENSIYIGVDAQIDYSKTDGNYIEITKRGVM